MGNRRNAKIFGLLLSVALVFSLVSACFAADNNDDLNHFGVRIRGLYILPHQGNHLGALGLGSVKVQDAVAPELDLEYFFTKNFSTELVLALSKHDIEIGGKTSASTWLLPPSLLFKFHPFPKAKISPYAGVGLNVVMPFDEKCYLGNDAIKVHTSVGAAGQVGVDVPITKNVFFNLDGKYYSTITHVKVLGVEHGMRISPFIIGTGLQYRF